MLTRRLAVAALTCLLLIALPLSVRADPVTVTSGDVQVETSLLLARIALSGTTFSFRTGTEDFFPDLRFCRPCESNTVSLGATWRPTAVTGATATVDGVHFDEVFVGFGSSATFTTEDITLTGSEPFTATVPFTFSGTIIGHSSFELDSPVFTLSLIGHGTARAQFAPVAGSDVPLFDNVTLPGADFQLQYVFSDVAQTPEPGTLVLIGSGALLVEARRRRQLRAPSEPSLLSTTTASTPR